jgi:hypothetical protein
MSAMAMLKQLKDRNHNHELLMFGEYLEITKKLKARIAKRQAP